MFLVFQHPRLEGFESFSKLEISELNGFIVINNKNYLWVTIPTDNNIAKLSDIYYLDEDIKFPKIEFGKNNVTLTFPINLIVEITR